jgi:radical SAM superfamily enzyme YgiQ (UPF0313 family)
MFRIGIVVPSWHYWDNPFKLQPLWELYYATVLERKLSPTANQIEVIDLRGSTGETLSDQVCAIADHDLFVYWIMKSGDSVEVRGIVELLRHQYPSSKHVAGGTHVDMCTDECLEIFDAVVVGPGEVSLVQVVRDIQITQLQKMYRQKYTEVSFSDTPYPRREFLPASAIVNNLLFQQYGGVPGTSVYFSRGCVYKCSFCVYNVPGFFQVRSPQMMKAEIAYLKETYGVEGINFRDEVIILPNERLSTIMFEALSESQVIWRGQTTTAATDKQLALARESGCQELAIGVETVDDQVMKNINKAWQTQKQVRHFIEQCKRVGIKIKMCLIFGLPGEPLDIVEKTMAFIEETEPDYIGLSGFCPVPGSPIFKNPTEYGIRYIDQDWSRHAHLLYRFGEQEEVGLPFEYEKENRWGKTFTREQIQQNIQLTQKWLNERAMVY